MAGNRKRDSPLVNSVVSLQQDLWELERVGARINAIEMTADIDVEFVQKLLVRFAECGERVSVELNTFSTHFQQAQARAETIAQEVSRQTEAFNTARDEQNREFQRFQLLGARVRELNVRIGQLSPLSPQATSEERTAFRSAVPDLKQELELLIGELADLRNSSRNSGIKSLEKSAHSLAQSLQAVHTKLGDVTGER